MRRITALILICILAAACRPQVAAQPVVTTPITATVTASLPPASPAPQTGVIGTENVRRLEILQMLGRGGVWGKPQYTPDGKWLVISASTGVYLYDTSNYQAEPRLLTPDTVGYFAISPDSRILSVGKALFSLADEKQLPALQQLSPNFDHTPVPMDQHFSPDGSLLALANNENLIGLWQIPDGRLLKTFEGQTIHFSPDGRFLLTSLHPASDSDNVHIYVYDIQEGKRLQDWQGESGELLPDGRALIQKGQKITIHELKTGRPLRVFEGQFGALAPDGESLLVLTQNVFRHYRIRDGKSLGILEGQFNGINTVSANFSPDGQMIAASTSQAVCCGGTKNAAFSLWRTDGHLVKNLHKEYGMLVVFFAFSPDGHTLIFSNIEQENLEIWQTTDAKLLTVLDGFTAPVTQLSFLPGSQQLVTSVYGGGRNPLTVYDVKTGRINRSWPTEINDSDYGLATDPNGQILALSNQFWQIRDGQPTATALTRKMTDVYSYAMQAVAFSPDGRYFAGGFFNNGRFQVWDFEQQTLLMDENSCEAYASVTSLSFSPDSQHLAVACLDGLDAENSAVSIYEISAYGKPLQVSKTRDAHSSNRAAYSPDGRYLAIATTHLELVNANSNEKTITLSTTAEIHSLSFSPDSRLLALGLENGTIELWSIPDGKLLFTIPGRHAYIYNPVEALAFSDNGKLLAAGYDDGGTLVWGLR